MTSWAPPEEPSSCIQEVFGKKPEVPFRPEAFGRPHLIPCTSESQSALLKELVFSGQASLQILLSAEMGIWGYVCVWEWIPHRNQVPVVSNQNRSLTCWTSTHNTMSS